MDLLTEKSASAELLGAVQRMRETEKVRMGRDYASAHEAWARLTELNEQGEEGSQERGRAAQRPLGRSEGAQ